MDTSYEDNMYRQIEKSLSNNINDRLFVPIEMIDKPAYMGRPNKQRTDSISQEENMEMDDSYDGNRIYNDRMESSPESDEGGPRLSRAEYIRQAREACLRQMNGLDVSGRASDFYLGDEDSIHSFGGRKRKDKAAGLFYEGNTEESSPEEMASFRSLIIRTVCAVVLFISIFIIDKIKVDWGAFSYETIRQYVTGNNQLKALEEIILSWIK